MGKLGKDQDMSPDQQQTSVKVSSEDYERVDNFLHRYSEEAREHVYRILTQAERNRFEKTLQRRISKAALESDLHKQLVELEAKSQQWRRIFPPPEPQKENEFAPDFKPKSKKKKGEGQRNRSFSFGKRNTR